jgi:hypothetical protein
VIVVSSGAAEAGPATTAERVSANRAANAEHACDRRRIDMEMFPK